MPMALWAFSMCFMHPALSPFFIAAFDMSSDQIAPVRLSIEAYQGIKSRGP
jgi:hypothetical protein